MKKFVGILAVFIFGFIFVNNTYAVSDVTGTLDSNITTNVALCNNNDNNLPNCSDFNYLILSSNSTLPSSGFWNLDIGEFYTRLPYSSYMVFDIDGVPAIYTKNYSTALANISYTYTLSENMGTPCPEPEEPDCPDCPDCDTPFIVQLFSNGFWGVATGLVAIIVPVLALFLLFRLVHDLLFKGSL